jgi:hypothetical protein
VGHDGPHQVGPAHRQVDGDRGAGARTDHDGRRRPQMLQKRCGTGSPPDLA